jgi:hypothetical protein
MMLARFLNNALGTTHITPWNLGEIPEHWIDLIVRMSEREAELREAGLAR